MTAGRPTKYHPGMGAKVLAFMSKGYSKMAAAGHIGVCYNTFRGFMDDHPEFLQAVKDGEAKRVVFLERGLLQAETGPQVTSRIFALKNAAPDEWKDKQALDHTSSDGSMTPRPGVDLSKLSDQALAELIAARDASADPKD
jgi:hypothetical protein